MPLHGTGKGFVTSGNPARRLHEATRAPAPTGRAQRWHLSAENWVLSQRWGPDADVL